MFNWIRRISYGASPVRRSEGQTSYTTAGLLTHLKQEGTGGLHVSLAATGAARLCV